MSEVYLGIDIGGTNLKYGVVSPDGKILFQETEPVKADHINDLREQCESVYKKAEKELSGDSIAGVGIGIPGFIDFQAGILNKSPNIPSLNRMNLKEKLGSIFPVKVVIDNDANAAAWGEYWLQDEQPDSMLLLTLGTGIGGGIIMHGELWRGNAGYAGEFGHIMARPGGRECGCGRHGCIEAEFSISALKAKVADALKMGEETSLAEIQEEITGHMILEAAMEGDEIARRLIQTGSRMLGQVTADLINAFNPEMILFGGGMIVAEEIIMPELKQAAESGAITGAYENCRIATSSLGNDAGLIGAAGLVIKAMEAPK